MSRYKPTEEDYSLIVEILEILGPMVKNAFDLESMSYLSSFTGSLSGAGKRYIFGFNVYKVVVVKGELRYLMCKKNDSIHLIRGSIFVDSKQEALDEIQGEIDKVLGELDKLQYEEWDNISARLLPDPSENTHVTTYCNGRTYWYDV